METPAGNDEEDDYVPMKIQVASQPEKEAEDKRYVTVPGTSQPAIKESDTEGYVSMVPLTTDKEADADGYVSARILDGPTSPDKTAESEDYEPMAPIHSAAQVRETDGYVSARVLDSPTHEKAEDSEVYEPMNSFTLPKKKQDMEEYVGMRSQTASRPTKNIEHYETMRSLSATLPAQKKKEAEAAGYDTVRTFAIALRPSPKPAAKKKKKKKRVDSELTEDGYENARILTTMPAPELPPKDKDDGDLPEDGYENSRPLATLPPSPPAEDSPYEIMKLQ